MYANARSLSSHNQNRPLMDEDDLQQLLNELQTLERFQS